MASRKQGFVPKIDSQRIKQWHRAGLNGFALVGLDSLLPAAESARSCETASNYVKGKVSEALGSVGNMLTDLGDAIAPSSEDIDQNSKLG